MCCNRISIDWSVTSVPANDSVWTLWRRLMTLRAGFLSAGGRTRSRKDSSLSPTAQLRERERRRGQEEEQRPPIVPHDRYDKSRWWSWGRRTTSQDNCFGVMTLRARIRDSGCRRTIPTRWLCRIRVCCRSISFHRQRLMHHRFHVLHTHKHRAKSPKSSFLNTLIHIWRLRTWTSPVSRSTVSAGGGIGAGRTTYLLITTRNSLSHTGPAPSPRLDLDPENPAGWSGFWPSPLSDGGLDLSFDRSLFEPFPFGDLFWWPLDPWPPPWQPRLAGDVCSWPTPLSCPRPAVLKKRGRSLVREAAMMRARVRPCNDKEQASMWWTQHEHQHSTLTGQGQGQVFWLVLLKIFTPNFQKVRMY